MSSSVKDIMVEEILLKPSHLLGSGRHGKTYNTIFKGKACTAKLLYGKLLKHNQSIEQLVSEFNERCTVCFHLDHSNLVKFIKVIQVNNEIVIINESMQMNLPTYMKQKGSDFSLGDQFSLCLDMSNGLYKLHNHSILHKNLHDDNVLVQGNQAKISDFYYSLLEDDNQDFAIPYVAPEVIKSFQSIFSHSSDVYSLGVLLLQVITNSTERAALEQIVNTVTEKVTRQAHIKNINVILCGLVDHVYECLNDDVKSRPSVTEICKYMRSVSQNIDVSVFDLKVSYSIIMYINKGIIIYYLFRHLCH